MPKHKVHKRVASVEEMVGHIFSDKDLVVSAITHSSAVENGPVSASYERLEFLGDSLLGAIVASELYLRFPRLDEGVLSRFKTWLISGKTLASVSKELGLSKVIIFGESERGTGARGMRKALEDVYEALVGALWCDDGIDAAHDFVNRTLMPLLDDDAVRELSHHDASPKSRLQEVVQREIRLPLTYRLVDETGPAHSPTFTSVALVGRQRIGRGSGSSKKASETAAAADALARIESGNTLRDLAFGPPFDEERDE